MSKKILPRLIAGVGFLAITVTMVYAANWAPGQAPQAAPGSGNVDLYWQADGDTGIQYAKNVKAKAFLYSSDKSLKENIAPITDALGKILALEGVSFNWKADGDAGVGLIAQDVEDVFPELVVTNSNGLKSVEYGNLVAPLIEAVKEQQKQIDSLKAEIESLKASCND